MTRFDLLYKDEDIGHYHCLSPINHFDYLNYFDWSTERILRWNGADSFALQLDKLHQNPLDNWTEWLCRAWDTLVATHAGKLARRTALPRGWRRDRCRPAAGGRGSG